MRRYVVKSDAGTYAVCDIHSNAWTWVAARAKAQSFHTWRFARNIANDVGGKVYRLRKPSAKREREKAVGYIRALGGTRMFAACNAALSAAACGIERGEHLAWRAPKEAK